MKTNVSVVKKAQQSLRKHRSDLALVIGNGINLTSGAAGGISWDQLMEDLISLAARSSPNPTSTATRLKSLLVRGDDGQTPASLPEIFDIIEAIRTVKPNSTSRSSSDLHLQAQIAQMLKKMKPGSPHRAVVKWAWDSGVPILTTNYDHCLQDGLDMKCERRLFGSGRPRSDFYPWDRYYAPGTVVDPACEFAVWHVHGDRDLKRSIRAGLDQYMGMAQRLRTLKRPIAKEILGGPDENHEGDPAYLAAPWLRIFMGRKLWIQGLGLRAAEVSLRWLLIQRFRYWRRYRPKHRKSSGWYIHGPTAKVGRLDEGRRAFFQNVGLDVIEIAAASDFYTTLFRIPEATNH